MSSKDQIIIVGAGLAGLCCALKLSEKGIPYTIVEASDGVGGRIRTDFVDDFVLDRGFQIFLTAYPEAQAVLNYPALYLKPFQPGAMVRAGTNFYRISDPFRCPEKAIETLLAPVGTIPDKLRVAWLRQKLVNEELQSKASTTTMTALKDNGFSSSLIQQFFRPFFSGIFLESELDTSAKLFDFIFKMLAEGDNVLPSQGMQAIPDQLAARLAKDSIRLNSRVTEVGKGEVTLDSGEIIMGKAVVLATEEPQTRKLLGQEFNGHCRSQTCMYFYSNEAPIDDAMIVLNGGQTGPVVNFSVPSNVSSSYAPPGKALISCVIVGDTTMPEDELEKRTRSQMQVWFGKKVDDWKHLRTYRIKYALPDQTPESLSKVDRSYNVGDQTYSCGDYKETGTINGAMLSGRKCAEAIIDAYK